MSHDSRRAQGTSKVDKSLKIYILTKIDLIPHVKKEKKNFEGNCDIVMWLGRSEDKGTIVF